MNLLSSNMDELADIFIRPSRHIYKVTDLGPRNALLQGKPVTRTDFEIKNKRGMTIRGSYFRREKEEKCNNFLIYLHCNSGCRIQGLSYLKLALQNQFNYVVFDFCGSGLSEGKYVSLGKFGNLGLHQVQDLEAVINYIKFQVNEDARFCLWGRSMGAVTALRYLGSNRESIKVAIFDSPFSSLQKLFLEIGKQKTNFPQILLNVVYKYIKPIILSKADFNIDQVNVQGMAKEIEIPGIFVASKQDSLIPFEQMDEVFNKYKGEKEMYFIEESHNEARNMGVIKKVFKTMKKYFLLSKQLELKKHKTSFYSILPLKDTGKRKLQLTIKSHSQRFINYQDYSVEKGNTRLDFSSQKKQTSCLLLNKEPRKMKKTSEIYLKLNHSESFVGTQRKPLAPKHVGSEDNLIKEEHFGRPKFAGETKMIQIKMKPAKLLDGRSRERKTFQHISSKRPPFVELKGTKEFRSSLELRYRS